MDLYKSNQNQSGKSQYSQQANPFARALAEAEKQGSLSSYSPGSNQLNPYENQVGQSFSSSLQDFHQNNLSLPNNQVDNDDLQSQSNSLFSGADRQLEQEKFFEDQKKKQMKEKLHRMINPVDQTDIFSAREEKRKKDLNKVREDLKALAEEIAQFYKEVDITLTQDIVAPGQTGVYHQNFFEKLRQVIQLLRQRVSSARTWARQAQQKRKKRKYRYGLDFHNYEAKSSHDMLHHERNNAFGA